MNILKTAAELMALSARTAPKAAGKDFVEIKVIGKREIKELSEEMYRYGKESGKGNYDRDGENVLNSDQVLLISLNNAETLGVNCGACGFKTCKELKLKSGPEFDGPICAWRLIDMGIAVGSAVKTASILNVDNRIMYRIGVAAKRLNLIDGEVVLGVPISGTGKNIYFDR